MDSNLNHIGIILDGNRRWAKAQGLPTLEGHKRGYDNFHDVAKYLLTEKKIPFVSAYIFSTENWNRTEKEVKYLMRLVTQALNDYLEEFHKGDIKIVVLGSRERLSSSVLKAIEKAEEKTAKNSSGTLALCFNYGGQLEIADAVNKIIQSGNSEITPALIEQNLYHPDVPPVDLLIRTSGELRISGFMLWRAAYSELYFTEKFWPDFNNEDADMAIAEYFSRQRRFGK